MSAVVLFIALSAGLTLIALAVLLRPWWRQPQARQASGDASPEIRNAHHSASLDIHRDQLRELERDRDEGLLAAADFTQAREALQRRLLAEMDAPATPPFTAAPRLGGRSALALVVAIPLAAALIYVQIGNPQALLPPQMAAQQRAQEIDAMLARLVERLQANPDDARGWLTLARAYKALGRFPEAAESFGKARALVDDDPALLADYAYALIRAAGGTVNARARALLDAALKLDPKQPQALFMAGLAANDRGDFAAAVIHWERLLPLLEPGSEEMAMLEEALDKAKAQAEAHAAALKDNPTPAEKTMKKAVSGARAKRRGGTP